jgi:SPOR domain
MLDRAQFVGARPRGAAAQPTFTMRKLERLALWASAAAAALFVAVIAGRSDVGSQRIAWFFSSAHPPSSRAAHPIEGAAAPPDSEAVTQQLVHAVRGLTEDRDRLMARLAAIEHHLDDVTGSVARQIEAARTPPWPDKAPPAPATRAVIASIVTPALPPPVGSAPLPGLAPPPELAPAAAPAAPAPPPQAVANAEATSAAAPPAEYGVDLGGARSVEVLHARWAAFRSARPKLFEGLKPLVSRKDSARSKRPEWRLLVGPFPDIDAAAGLCASLAVVWPICTPATFQGEHLAEKSSAD